MTESGEANALLGLGHEAADRIRPLIEIETLLGVRPRSDRRPSRFRRLGRLFVGDPYLASEIMRRCLPTRNGGDLPRLNSHSLLSLLRHRLGGAAYDWPVRADAILFAANVRGFYVSPDQVTIKVKGPGRSAAEFREDVQARRRVAESGLVEVPAVLHADLSAADPYVVDQYIAGQRGHWLKHRRLLLNELTPKFWLMYQTFGMTLEPCRDSFDIEAIAGRLQDLPLDPGCTRELRCRDLLVDIASSLTHHQDEALVRAFGHGDLSVGNMIVAPGNKLYVVDWELSRRQSIAWDFRKLLLHVPEVWDRLCVLLEDEIRCQRWRDVMEPRRQLLLSLCAYIANWDFAAGATEGSSTVAQPRGATKGRAILSAANRLMGEIPQHFQTRGF